MSYTRTIAVCVLLSVAFLDNGRSAVAQERRLLAMVGKAIRNRSTFKNRRS
jgi:hypothetical protein